MARTTVTVTVIFYLFAFAYARIPSNFAVNDVNHPDLPTSLPEPDIKATILLPSANEHSDQSSVIESIDSEPEPADPKSLISETQTIDDGEELQGTVTESVSSIPLISRPLTFVTFRPVNRHFNLKRSYPFRFPRRNCHHHHHRHIRPGIDRLSGTEVSYGNDMILSGESNGFDPVMLDGGVRQIPPRWLRVHHHYHNRHHHDGEELFSKKNLKKWLDEDQDQNQDQDREQVEVKEETTEKEEGGFMNRIRKFLNHF